MITQNFSYLKYQKYSEIWDILAHGVRSEKVNNRLKPDKVDGRMIKTKKQNNKIGN